MAILTLRLTVPDAGQTLVDQLRLNGNANDSAADLQQIATWITGRASGFTGQGTAAVAHVNATQSTGTITLSGNPSAADTVTIAGKVVTFVASGATGLQVNIGGSATITAASLAALINSNSNFTDIVTATSNAGVVTLTSAGTGNIANTITLAKSGTNLAVSGATLTGATTGTRYALSRG